jgi:hypothetical protein
MLLRNPLDNARWAMTDDIVFLVVVPLRNLDAEVSLTKRRAHEGFYLW